MAPLTAGFRPFIYPDSGPKYDRSGKILDPAFRYLDENLNFEKHVVGRYVFDFTNPGPNKNFVLDTTALAYVFIISKNDEGPISFSNFFVDDPFLI